MKPLTARNYLGKRIDEFPYTYANLRDDFDHGVDILWWEVNGKVIKPSVGMLTIDLATSLSQLFTAQELKQKYQALSV